jgi:hypothetical protein
VTDGVSRGGCCTGGRPVPAEASWWFDCQEFGEVEVADRQQRFGGGAFMQVGWQCLQPGDALGLHRRQFGDGITPALDAAASVGWGADVDGGPARGLGGSMASLAFGIGHRPVADRPTRHAPLKRKPETLPRDQGLRQNHRRRRARAPSVRFAPLARPTLRLC